MKHSQAPDGRAKSFKVKSHKTQLDAMTSPNSETEAYGHEWHLFVDILLTAAVQKGIMRTK